jgi:hypothetical protein
LHGGLASNSAAGSLLEQQECVSMSAAIASMTADECSQFTNGYTVLLNPEPEAIVKVLATVQGRARKNLLNADEAIAAYQRVVQQGCGSAHAGVKQCPPYFSFGVTSTVIQVVRLDEGLIACAIGRHQVMPGDEGQPPVTADPIESPRQWLKQVLSTFWTHLDDAQVAALQHWAVAAAMAYAAGQEREQTHHRGVARAAVRRRLQLQALFRSTRPVYVSELADVLRSIGDELDRQAEDTITWQLFQKRWPSVASRYRRELLSLFSRGSARREALERAQPHKPKYSLAFDTWSGAQTVFAGTQLVFQVCSPLLAVTKDAVQDLPPPALRNTLHLRAAHSPHPASLETVGWLRVHVDDLHRLIFIDEVQSDVQEHLLELAERGDAGALALSKALADWHINGFSSVRRWAEIIGYGIAMHSRESAAAVPDKTRSLRKWTTLYGTLIRRFKLIKVDCAGYPGPIHVDATSASRTTA